MTYTEAIESIKKHFYTEWENESVNICGYVPEVRWWNRENKAVKPDVTKHFVRFSHQVVSNEQSSFRGPAKETYGLRYTNIGLIFIQLFFSKISLQEDHDAKLSELAQNIWIQNHRRDSVIFRKSKIQELPEELDFFRANVIAEYEFDCIYQ